MRGAPLPAVWQTAESGGRWEGLLSHLQQVREGTTAVKRGSLTMLCDKQKRVREVGRAAPITCSSTRHRRSSLV